MYIKGKKAHNLVDNPIEQYKSSSAHPTVGYQVPIYTHMSSICDVIGYDRATVLIYSKSLPALLWRFGIKSSGPLGKV